MFTGLTRELCEKAWETILPAIEKAAADGTVVRRAGVVVVLDPTSAEGAVLFEGRVSDEDVDRYGEIARAKAALTRRTGLPTARVASDAPFLFTDGDIKWGGSTIRDGLVVAFSGVQGQYDEVISEWMASAIRGMCRWEMDRAGGAMAQPGGWLKN
jgi:hypothetical protein